MQLLYGNDGINYHTIAKSKEITANQEKELLAGYLGYDFVNDTSKYSSALKEPISFSYVTTDLAGSLPCEMILISQNAKMSNYLTPSYYSHFRFFKMDMDSYGEEFFKLLKCPFVKDVDLNSYLKQDIDTFQKMADESIRIRRDALPKEKIYPIVASLLDVADSISRQVKLVLDVEGDEYNQRALEVIATIYSYIPYNIRKKLGFSTYAGTDSAISSRVKFQLYTRDSLKVLGSNAIDLANMEHTVALNRISENVKNLAKDFAEAAEESRLEWFGIFQTVFQLNSVTVEEHATLFKNLRRWQTGDLESMKDELAMYAYVEQQKEGENHVFHIFRNIMDQRFRNENYTIRYLDIIKKILANQKDFDFDNKLKAYLMLGEAVPAVVFDAVPFLEWEQKTIIETAERKYQDLELYKHLKSSHKRLREAKNGKEKFARIHERMEQLLKRKMELLATEIKQRIKEEEEPLISFFQRKFMQPADLGEISRRYKGIHYSQNKKVFHSRLYENMMQYLNSIPYFKSALQLRQYKRFADLCKDYLEGKNYEKVIALVNERGEIAVAMERCKVIGWKDKKDVLESYQNIAMMRALTQGKEVEQPDYILNIGKEQFGLNETQLETVINYLLGADRNLERPFRKILDENDQLLECLIGIEVFGEEHFKFLLGNITDLSKQKAILEYYLKADNMLTETEVSYILNGISTSSLERIEESVNSSNIIGLALKKKVRRKTREFEESENELKERASYRSHQGKLEYSDGKEYFERKRKEEENKEDNGERRSAECEDKNPLKEQRTLAEQKEQEETESRNDNRTSYTNIVLMGITYCALMFGVSVAVNTFVSSNIMIPIIFSLVSMALLIIAFAYRMLSDRKSGAWSLGIMLGTIISLPITWGVWFFVK